MMHSIVELDCSRVADQLDSDPLCFFNYRTIRRELGLEVEMLELTLEPGRWCGGLVRRRGPEKRLFYGDRGRDGLMAA